MNIPAPFAAVDVNFDSKTEMSLLLESTAGYASVTYGPNFPGPGNATNPTPSGLVTGTTYTASLLVDGTHTVAISIVGANALTISTLMTELNTDVIVGSFATVALVGNQIVITSASTGAASSVVITDTNLFSSIKGTTFSELTAYATSVVGGTEYVRWDKLGKSTQSTVASAIDSFLLATTTNTNTPWTSGTDVLAFTPIAPDTTVEYNTVTGLTYLPTVPYDINIAVDGGAAVNVALNLAAPAAPDAPVTFGVLLEALNLALASAAFVSGKGATATFAPGAVGTLTVSSDSVGTGSTIAITAGTNNDVITALAAFAPANGPLGGYEAVTFTATVPVTPTTSPAIGGAGTSYDFAVSISGAAQTVGTVSLITADTMTTIAGKMQAAIAGITVAAVGDALVITNAATGTNASINIAHPVTGANPFLFTSLGTALTATVTYGPAVAGVGGGAGVDGVTNVTFPVTKTPVNGANESPSSAGVAKVFRSWSDVMQFWPSVTGFGALWTAGTNANKFKGPKPAAKGDAVRTAVYYNGTNWVYFDTGASIGGTGTTVVPPELV